MTKVWTALAITVLIFTLAFAEFKLTENTAREISDIIEQTEISAKNESENTERLCGEIKEIWDKRKVGLEIFLSHGEMDKVDISIENLNRYCELNNFEKVYTECGVLKNYMNSLTDSEDINMHNIF